MPENIHLTVAAVVCRNNEYLMVREQSDDTVANKTTVINQPAGHVEPGESPLEAVKRETLEETGWHVQPSALLSFGVFTSTANRLTYYRFTFICEAVRQQTNVNIDPDIVEVLWLSEEQLLSADPPRSPMVMQAIDDYQSGIRYPLEFIRDYR